MARAPELIFSAPKPRARGALGGFGTSEIAIAVLKLCPGDPCVRARHAAAATCAETQQQRLRRRPPRAPRFLHVLGALVGLGAEFGGACGSRRSPRGGLWSGPAGAGADAAATLPLLRSLLQLVGRAPALPAAAVGSGVAQLRPGAAQQASWGLWWGCAWASARGLRLGHAAG